MDSVFFQKLTGGNPQRIRHRKKGIQRDALQCGPVVGLHLTDKGPAFPDQFGNLLHRIADHIGCRDVVNTTTAKHDAIIAYTSQVMHIMAVAVCDDPDLFDCKGFEGGSFRDCTRVAALDVPLWTELFSMNAPALCKVIRNLEDNLRAYREVIASGDTAALAEKLAWSADRKRHMNLE